MMVKEEIKKTPMYERHLELGANMVDFHRWLMPMQYKGIIAEHKAVRNDAGIFDVSHMGQVEVKGEDAYNFVQSIVTNNLDKIKPGRALYAAMCNENGGMVDDLIVYFISKTHILLIVNASCLYDDFKWICSKKGGYSVLIDDISATKSLIALQGPRAHKIMEEFLGVGLSDLKRFRFKEFVVSGNKIFVARTGYTGEDGFELSVDASLGCWLWDELMKFNPMPVGLGARNTLRLEKGFLLYGNDTNLDTTPIEAGIGWAVDLNKDNFIGKEALQKNKPRKKLVMIEGIDKGIPRKGCIILCRDLKIGTVTSGSFSPSLNKGIALGYVTRTCEDVNIEIRGKIVKGKIKSKS